MDWSQIVEIAKDGVEQLWSFFSVSLMVYYCGEASKKVAIARGWRGTVEHPKFYDAILPVMPLLAGALLMQIPFPVLNAIDAMGKSDGWELEVAGRAGWGGLAGCVSGQVFEIAQTIGRFVKRRLGDRERERAQSDPPKPPRDES